MGEDLGPRGRKLPLGDRRVSRDPVETLFRGIWKLVFVVVVTLAVLFAIGWVIQAVTDPPRSVTTTVEEP